MLDGHSWDLDSDYALEFHEHTSTSQPKIVGPVPVSLSVGGTTVFTGDLVSADPTIGANGRTWCYRCLGLKNRANWLPVVAIDGAGTIRFNTPLMDIDNYNASFAGKSVGDILDSVLTSHATALTAAGITTDGTTATQLAALTLVPSEEVVVAGERLWQALEGVLQKHARNIRLTILPSGLVRLIDVTVGSTHTLTLGTDRVDPPLFSRNWAHNATRTVIRGKGLIYPAYVSVLNGTLTPAWSPTQEANWKYTDFTEGGDASDAGTVDSVDSATQIHVSSDFPGRTWATNFWPGVEAWIYLEKTSGSGLTYTESRPITACASHSAASSTTITLGFDLENSGAAAFDRYRIIGTNVPLSSTGLADVWRLYDVTDPGGLISGHLVQHFPVPVPFIGYHGQSAFLTNTPSGQVFQHDGSGPAYFQVLPATGQILFYRPVVEQTSTIAAMTIGGGAVTTPDDVYCLLAYSRGSLQEPYPPDSGGPVYSGTAYSLAGLSRTQYVDVDSWQYAGNRTVLAQLAQMIQQSTRDTLMEGAVTYKGYYSTVQDPSGGHKLSFDTTDPGYPSTLTGDESLAIPVRAVSYRYLTEGGGLLYSTQMRCSTRQDPRTGESQYMHLSVLGAGSGLGMQLDGAFSAGNPTMGFGPAFTPENTTTQSPGFVDMGTEDMTGRDKYGRSKAEKLPAAEKLGTGEGPAKTPFERLPGRRPGPKGQRLKSKADRDQAAETRDYLEGGSDQGYQPDAMTQAYTPGADKPASIADDQIESSRRLAARKKSEEPLINLSKRPDDPASVANAPRYHPRGKASKRRENARSNSDDPESGQDSDPGTEVAG